MDKYYTIAATAQLLVSSVDALEKFELIVEPGAGAGSILRALRLRLSGGGWTGRLVGFDVEPPDQCDSAIVVRDFLAGDAVHELRSAENTERCLVIGNPPFGRQASLAVRFFNRAAAHSCVQCIAFIVPKSFRKESVQNRLSLDFVLQREVEIPEKSFVTVDGRAKAVRCVIQVWRRSERKREKAPRYSCNGKYHFVGRATRMCLAFGAG
ncbi:MAG: hypothetical protein JSS83_28770 [Cyanobacteria bacterium SZAS LIN-3]|nr:hypothetical protein [Cyanobacteria bacterium SZAS LIN-3]